jgi:antitoxin component of MazEF toxin-antitoxin module
MEVKTIARKWGSSIGVILPKNVVEAKKIRESDEVVITIEKIRPKAGVLFGYLKGWKKPTQEIKNELREGWESDSDRKRNEKWKV